MKMGEGGIILSKEQLRTLAKLIQCQEEERIKSIPFRSERDRGDYLRCSRGAYTVTVGLLDDDGSSATPSSRDKRNTEPSSDSDTDPDPKPVDEVVKEYLAYLEMAVGLGMQTVKNVHLRHEFLNTVREKADEMKVKIDEIRNPDSGLSEEEIELLSQQLVEEFSLYKYAMQTSLIKKADISSQNFAKALKLTGWSFEDLVAKYHNKLEREIGPEYDMLFEDLEDEKKIEVYDEILKSYGRGTYLKNTLYRVADAVGKGLLLLTLGMSVWDVYSSEHKIQTTVSEVAEFGAGYVGGNLGEAGGAAVATYLVTAVGVAETAATAAFVGLAAFATGTGIGIALGFLAGYVVNKIFESGGKDTGGVLTVKKSSEHSKPVAPTHHFQVYVAPMPDGARLARQVAYKGAPTSTTTTSTSSPIATNA